MRRSLLGIPVALALLAGCAPTPPPEPAVDLPASLRQPGAQDPARGAIVSTSSAFARPGAFAGRPAEAASALAEVEWLTVNLASDPRWIGLDPLVQPQMREARAEIRGVLGIPAATPPQAVITALDRSAAALRQGDRAAALAALAPVTGPGGAEAALARLSDLPPLPRTRQATATAGNALNDLDRRTPRRG